MVRIWMLVKASFLTNVRYKVNFIMESFGIMIPMIPAVTLLLNGNNTVLGFESAQQYALYLVVAFAVWGFVENLWSFTFTMRSKMREGTLNETLMMPVSYTELIIGWSMDGMIKTVVSSIPLIIVGGCLVCFNTTFGNTVTALVILLLSVLSGYCFGLMLIGLMLVWRETDQLVSFIGNIAPFICGLIIPMVKLPSVVVYMSMPIPYTWALDLIRALVFNYPTYLDFGIECGVFVAELVIYYFFSRKIFVYFNTKAKKNGGIIGF